MRTFAKGNRVSQPQYGPGTITSSDETYTVIEFDNHGKRTFLTSKVTLESTTEPAPSKPGREKRKAAPKEPKEPKAAKQPKTKPQSAS